MKILSIDTSCDETSVAITEGRKVLAHTSYSQILMHNEWGGVVPSLAKRAHEEKIDYVIENVLKKYKRFVGVRSSVPNRRDNPRVVPTLMGGKTPTLRDIDCIAVTQGPGLAIALEVGIKKAKELALLYRKKLIAVNHMEGHTYSVFAQNSKGNPPREIQFPYLVLLISGAHTEIVIFKNHLEYEVIGKTLDDAAGEALDKAGRLMGLGYPAGAAIERLANDVDYRDDYKFPRPMLRSNDLNFSFSGLKTAFFYHLKKMSEEEKTHEVKQLVSSFQEAVFDSLLFKTERAMKQTRITNLIVAGGVAANQRLRLQLRKRVKIYNGTVLFPPFKYLNGDNAAMIGIAAHFKAEKNMFANPEALDRIPKMSL